MISTITLPSETVRTIVANMSIVKFKTVHQPKKSFKISTLFILYPSVVQKLTVNFVDI